MGLQLVLPVATLAVVLMLGPHCAVVPETGRPQLMSVSPDEETRLGLQAFEQYKKKARVSGDQALAERVRRIGRRLSAVASVPGAQWEFVLF